MARVAWRGAATADHPFADLEPSPGAHFRLCYYGAVLHLLESAFAGATPEAALAGFPFLDAYRAELLGRGLGEAAPSDTERWWQDALASWEQRAPGHLPLRALRDEAGFDEIGLRTLMLAGLVDEEARFGLVFEALQGQAGQRRPTIGLLGAWSAERGEAEGARSALRRLLELGLLRPTNPEAPRTEWALQCPTPLWDALRGEPRPTLPPSMCLRRPEELTPIEELIVPESLRSALAALPALLAAGEADGLIVRGPEQNGRRTALGAVARALGRGLLEVRGQARPDDERWRLVGPLATLLRALPVAVLDLAPGETAELPALSGYGGPVGVVLGKQGGVVGPSLERALGLTLPMPGVEERRRHWLAALGPSAGPELDPIADRFRMTGGNVRRAAALTRSYAQLDGRGAVGLADARLACRALNRQGLDTLATPVTAQGDWTQLAVAPETLRELRHLELRCQHRERIGASVGASLAADLNPGVRALFSGPSGTGKSLAARLLAAALQMDLYRLDLSTVVNKYIGETEKNLSRVFARAEELDVILLLDEGDALLTQRTSVQTANDRYANLETNYLLQRLESFEGILVVTTNASQRIDDAFQRRMDVVVDFHPPEPSERWAIWQLHLPGTHRVEPALLDEVARRCALSGGQIRNAVLHASLLGLEDGGAIDSAHLEAAVEREYRKTGAVCPLRTGPRRG